MSVDKNVVMMAEQVGLFLAPTLRSIVGSLFAEAVGGLLGKMAEAQSATEKLRADLEIRSAAIDALTADLRQSRTDYDAKLLQLSELSGTLASKADLEGSAEAASRATAETERQIEAVATLLRETRATGEQQVSAIKDTVRDLTSTHATEMAALSKALEPVVAGVEVVRQTLDVVTAKQNEDLGFLSGVTNTLREELVAVSARVKSVEFAVDDTRNALVTESNERSTLKQGIAEVRASVVELQAAEPKLVTVKAEPDTALIEAAVSRAVGAIQVPAPDMDALAVEARTAAAEAAERLVPQVREALAANVRDEVSRAVAALPVPKDGKDGDPGPAGLMGAVEPFIEGCVYERLALVSHAGGTWQATRRTKTAPSANLPDWQGIAAGVSTVAVQATGNLRSVEVVAALTNGDTVRSTIEVPAMVYRDVYSGEAAYDPADVVTYAGSMWLALKKTTGEQPSKSPDAWRLVVKRGQEGKDGKDGKDGVQFQAGFDGEYEENKAYARNAIVTYASSIWMSKRPTKERPPYLSNQDNEHWLRLR
jgi:hypothetical protein